MTKLTKKQRKQIAEFLRLAYERELSEALAVLETGFQRWRAGEISAADLDNLIHDHHQGPSRKIWKMYSSTSDWEIALPGAIHRGFLSVEDFPEDFWVAFGPRIEEIRNGLFEHNA
jgi:hypothetical protein